MQGMVVFLFPTPNYLIEGENFYKGYVKRTNVPNIKWGQTEYCFTHKIYSDKSIFLCLLIFSPEREIIPNHFYSLYVSISFNSIRATCYIWKIKISLESQNNDAGSLQDHQHASFEFGIIDGVLQSLSVDCQTDCSNCSSYWTILLFDLLTEPPIDFRLLM